MEPGALDEALTMVEELCAGLVTDEISADVELTSAISRRTKPTKSRIWALIWAGRGVQKVGSRGCDLSLE